MDKQRLMELAGISEAEMDNTGQLHHEFEVGDQDQAERIALMIRNPVKGWHANARNGVVKITVNVDTATSFDPWSKDTPALLRRQAY